MTNLADIERRAIEITADLDRKLGPYRAEITEATPQWHMVLTAPGQENKATDYLAARGIGVFLPRFVKGSVLRHELVVDLSDKLLFPGRVFLFCWDVLHHWRRIMACPGVQRILCDGNERPIVVPDTEIDRIQLMQYVLAVARPKRRKRYAAADDRITLSTRGYIQIDGNGRTRVLDRVLGAAS